MKTHKLKKLALLVVICLTLALSLSPAFFDLSDSGRATVLAATEWAPNTAYKAGDIVTYQGKNYKCLQAHTSLTGWEPATTPALWEVSAGGTPVPTSTATPTRTATATPTPTRPATPTVTPGGTTWQPGVAYKAGDSVTYQGNVYKCLQPHTAQVGWEPPVAQTLWQLDTTNSPTPTPIAPGGSWPTQVFAPYVDATAWPIFNIVQAANTTGNKYFTLAFFIGANNTCTAAWGGVIPLDQNHMVSDIAGLRAIGGDVIISFGGVAGMELAQACTTDASLKAQYSAVISKYNASQVDFDIEGTGVGDTAANDRRARVLASLQAEARSAGKQLKVSYTLPVMPWGLDTSGVNIIKSAIANGVDVSVVNIMTMDYGNVAPPDKMGQNAIDAAQNTYNQLRPLYPSKTDAQVWAMLGITPMIGVNDVQPEVFSLQDAQQVLTFAQQKKVGRLAFWSENRDKACSNGTGGSASPACSGVAQNPFDFSNVFKQYTR